MMNVKFTQVIRVTSLLILVLGNTTAINAYSLTISMPNVNWINQYAIGMCSSIYNSNNYMTWNQVQAAQNDSINIANNEVICIVGHGAAGSIGGVQAETIAPTITDRINRTGGDTNPVLLMACQSAVQPPGQGQSVMQAFQAIGGSWAGNPISGSLGICVANRNGNTPLYRTVLKNPLDNTGQCSQASLGTQQNNLKNNIQGNIDNCQNNNVGDLAIGQCMYDTSNPDGLAINNNFYVPFLSYISTNNCNQNPGVVQGTM